MKNIKLFLFTLFLFLVYGCSKWSTVYNFAPIQKYPKSISINSIKLEELELESIISSYVGKLFINNENIGFVDQRFCWVFMFDKDGMFIERHLGQGHGPMEIETGVIEGYALLNDGSYFFIGRSTDGHIFDEQFQRKETFIINRNANKNVKGYEQPYFYTICYENLIMKNYGDYLYYNLFLAHPKYNFLSASDYHKKAHIISKLNLQTGVMEQVLGHYPEIYAKDKSLRQLSFVNFDMDSNGNFYVSYEADSLIYTFDKDFSPLTTFGYRGSNMVDRRLIFNTIDEYNENYMQNRRERGMYNGLNYIDETGLLLRTYQKGSGTGGGLQIYKQSVLIGDVDVPDGFKIIGYIAPYYYASCGIDEDNERIVLQRFKLQEL